MKKHLALIITVFMLFIMSGCGGEDDHNGDHITHAENGDIQERTESLETLPSFLDKAPEKTRQVYQIAALNYDVMQWIPCYCGCGESAGHESNMNCFFKEVKDGAVVWDDHGTRCVMCMEIAVETAMMKSEGKSNLDIRNYIDEKYGPIGAKGTPTPMPES